MTVLMMVMVMTFMLFIVIMMVVMAMLLLLMIVIVVVIIVMMIMVVLLKSFAPTSRRVNLSKIKTVSCKDLSHINLAMVRLNYIDVGVNCIDNSADLTELLL